MDADSGQEQQYCKAGRWKLDDNILRQIHSNLPPNI